MKQILKRGLSILLTAAMIVTVFSGCNNNVESENTENPDTIKAVASTVDYRSDGKYITEITVENVSLAGITADDVEVRYPVIDSDGLNAALLEAENEEDFDPDKYISTETATVTDLTVKDDHTMTLSFIDERAADNFTVGYGVYIESKKIGAGVYVEFSEFTLTPEVEYVLSSDKDIRLTLVLDDGEFAEDISKDSIGLRGSFEEMKIESLSSAGKNLTMQLTGELVKHEGSGIYLDGYVDVYADGIINAYCTTSARVPVKTEAAYFASSEMTVRGSTVKVPLVLIDVVDMASLTMDSFAFESGVAVTDCTMDSNTQVTLTLTVDGASDKNSAAAALNGQTVKIGDDYEFVASFVPAGFYPVFDYVEKDGNNLKFTLELYVNSGTFADSLTKDMFSFGYDFEGASVVSIEKTGDTTAELIISVPANGQTTEELAMDGEVIVAAGALINSWGDASESEASYMRNYSQDSMGRDLSTTDIDSIKSIVGGFGNTTFGTISSVASGAIAGASAVKTILEMTGIIQSEHAQVMEKLEEISNGIEEIKGILEQNTALINELRIDADKKGYKDFVTDLDNLISYCKYAAGYYAKGEALLNKGYLIQQESETVKINVPSDKSSDDEWRTYYSALATAMLQEQDNRNADFRGFREAMEQLRGLYTGVANQVKQTDNTNPIYYFDHYCSLTYNFDSSAYPARAAFRLKIDYALKTALAYLMIYYNIQGGSSEYLTVFNAAETELAKRDIKQSDTVHVYVTGTDFNKTKIVKGSTADYTFSTIKRNFTDSEITEFISRMPKGTTLRNEFEQAGITVSDGSTLFGISFLRTPDSTGLALSWRKTVKQDDWKDFFDWETVNYYAKVIKWDSREVEELRTYYHNWEEKYLWYDEVDETETYYLVRSFE